MWNRLVTPPIDDREGMGEGVRAKVIRSRMEGGSGCPRRL